MTGYYCSADGTVKYDPIPDTYPQIIVHIGGYYISLDPCDFTITMAGPPLFIKWEYVQANIPPYNGLISINYGTSIIFHKDHGQYNANQDLICIRNITGDNIPQGHPGDPNNWPLVGAVIYDNAGNYRTYQGNAPYIYSASGGQILNNLYKVNASLGQAEYMKYKQTLTYDPSVVTQL